MSSPQGMEIRIGTSGWHYAHWRGPYYPIDLPAARMLQHYLADFDTVELNNTFYRLPTPAVMEAWRERTPPGFRFAVKASRFLTHMKKLKDPETGLGRFLSVVEVLKEKLGPILFQLPPRWSCQVERLHAFLEALPRRHRYAFEFRDATWHCRAVYRLLERYDVALCVYDLAGFQSPVVLTTDMAYLRFHGPGKAYQGDYSRRTLAAWAKRIRAWTDVRTTYVYFDNDEAGYAVKNARELKARAGLATSPGRRPRSRTSASPTRLPPR